MQFNSYLASHTSWNDAIQFIWVSLLLTTNDDYARKPRCSFLTLFPFHRSRIGGYDMEEKAARSYDLAALKYWGPSTHINFPVIFNPVCLRPCQFDCFIATKIILLPFLFQLENYQEELEEMKNMGRQEYVAHLRR